MFNPLPFQCGHCSGACTRIGKHSATQLYQCRACGKYQRSTYRNKACTPGVDGRITTYVREGCGIRSIARIIGISATTVVTRIKRIAARLGPAIIPKGRVYEVDELATYVGHRKNRVWVAYALDRQDKRIAALRVGKRSKRMLRPLVDNLLLADAKSIRTDGLDLYRLLVPPSVHQVKRFGTNHIERMNVD
jgi:IS1 family transposase